MSPVHQVHIYLHFLGNGTQYHTIGDMHGISEATDYCIVKNIISAMNKVLLKTLIRWPNNMISVVQEFHNIVSIPLVIGCVDGTLIKIDAPSINEPAFVD